MDISNFYLMKIKNFLKKILQVNKISTDLHHEKHINSENATLIFANQKQ